LLQLEEVSDSIAILAPWLSVDFKDTIEAVAKGEGSLQTIQLLVNSLDINTSYVLLLENYHSCLKQLNEITPSNDRNSPAAILILKFREMIVRSLLHVEGILRSAQDSAQFLDQKFTEMKFDFLLEKDRQVFTIGYNLSDRKFDTGLYDLLGSESRLASFIAIAKGDVKQEHWFRLGRQLVPTSSGRALVSWTASMFEYLMPLLVLRDYENTLLSETVHSVVKSQIKYGFDRQVPWGISEAGYNARDLQLNYQYGPFGIPGLGLKRGLSQDLVVSPYSTLLAAQVNPVAAIQNLKRLVHEKLLTQFGFYESVDYTPERLADHEKSSVVRSFMAHHQGMSFVSINNVLQKNIVQDRFHRDPRVRATQLLLQERVPQDILLAPPKAAEIEMETQFQDSAQSLIKHYDNPNSSTPRIHLLSNQNYSVMISTGGGGYSKCGGLSVTRWKEDSTRDNCGSFIFVKNLTQKSFWSTSFLPFGLLPEEYKVSFGEEKVEFRRRDQDISTFTQILVAPEDDVEIRYVTLTNHSDKSQLLELTSYLEPVLGPADNDLEHLTFSKLFIQTEFVASKSALLARRRKRSNLDLESWGLHGVVTDGELISEVQYETDREKFIGRGRTLLDSLAISTEEAFTNSSGSTIDPILSLRLRIKVPENASVRVAFTTGLTFNREKALELADRYHDIHAFDRECRLAWMQAQVDLRHLNVDSQTAYLYQRLAERILYLEPSLRSPSHIRAANTFTQANLWTMGIGGDLPIVVVAISERKDIAVIRKLLRCHEYLRLKGLIFDFVIINEHEASYHQDLQDDLLQQVRSTGSQNWLNKNGGIFILRRGIASMKEISHIQAIARVSLSAGEPLSEQVNRRAVAEKYPALASFSQIPRKEKTASRPLLPLQFFNGFGGFSQEAKEYVITLSKNQWTPAPWINVIGNSAGFGFQVSETGSGFTWSKNSQSNRLTPWSNDPVSDPSGEIIYLRDDETGEIWSPTPLPIKSQNSFTIRHGQGYTFFEHVDHGIEHSLKQFVAKEDPIKISLLKIKNLTSRKRKLTIVSYTEWVLGTRREKTSPYLFCKADKESGAIFAKNPHDNEFASQVSFADISELDRTFTCSRKEFIGRNKNYSNPAALKRQGLSQKEGTFEDPCTALQTTIELKAGEEFEMSILLGQCESEVLARNLTLRYRDLDMAKQALDEVTLFWCQLTEAIQIKTPEPAMDLLMNKWLLYQSLSCRYWSRTAFYQSGGAYGFRDQLQDCMAFVYAAPKIAREHILRASQHQFKEGDVQHWWHPPSDRGIRTKISDDLLWLPLVVSFYVNVTGDRTLLDEVTPFLEAPLLNDDEEDSYTLPAISTESASVFEHCLRAINRSLLLGQHGLPLIGTGDWNDGMNRVGILGQGESVWLGWFLYKVLDDFLPFCDKPELSSVRVLYQSQMNKLKEALETQGWDGEWYRRAFFDDGVPLGSKMNEECRIDSISQTWAVLSKAGDKERILQSMKKVEELLVRKNSKLILLLDPPFDKGSKDPGYIKGYVPGVRENGGQYTHAAVWVAMAYAELGDGNRAFDIFKMLNPIFHSQDQAKASQYKIEPYVLAGDVYAGEESEGRGGWSWYTGSASWYYRAGLESILGFNLRGNKLKIIPCVPNDWKEYEISYLFGKSKYLIEVKNPYCLNTGSTRIEMDGAIIQASEIELVDDGESHRVSFTIHDKSEK
jgi:cyclic beta-1,2-glucan synthetase